MISNNNLNLKLNNILNLKNILQLSQYKNILNNKYINLIINLKLSHIMNLLNKIPIKMGLHIKKNVKNWNIFEY